MPADLISRRLLLKRAAALGLLAAAEHLLPPWVLAGRATESSSPVLLSGEVIDLTISEAPFTLDGRTATAMTINGTIPGPIIRLKEGQQVDLARHEPARRNSHRFTGMDSCYLPIWTECPVSASAASSRDDLYLSLSSQTERHVLVS